MSSVFTVELFKLKVLCGVLDHWQRYRTMFSPVGPCFVCAVHMHTHEHTGNAMHIPAAASLVAVTHQVHCKAPSKARKNMTAS